MASADEKPDDEIQRITASRAKFARHSIVVNLAIVVAVLTIAATVTVGMAGYYVARSIIEDQVFARLSTAGSDRHELAISYVAQQHERAKLVASRTRLRNVISDFVRGDISRESMQKETQPILQDARDSTDEFRQIWMVDRDGKVFSCSDDRELDRTFPPALLATGLHEPILSEPAASEGLPSSLLIAPALAKDGSILGATVVDVDVTRLLTILSSPRLGETGQITVGRFEGDNIRFLFPPRQWNDNAAKKDDVPAMAKAIGDQCQTEVSTYLGEEALTYFRPIQLQPDQFMRWGLVASMSTAEAWRPLATFRQRGFVLLWIVVLLSIWAAFFLARRLTRPVRRLTALATEVADGKLDVQIPIKSRDEVGLLGNAFNRMTRALQRSYRTLEDRNESLENVNELLELKNHELEQIVYTMSHDLKSPLVTARGFLGILREDLSPIEVPDIADAIARIDRATLHMVALIEQLLELSRIGRHTHPKEWIDVQQIVEDFSTSVFSNPLFEGRTVEVSGSLPKVFADPTRLRQVVDNLLSNSLKYGTTDEQPTVTVEGHETDSHVCFKVIDHGDGIPDEFHSRIFLPFERLTAEKKGTGIGLAIVAKIIENEGGEITIEHTPGGGATFLIMLPKPDSK